MQAFTGNANFVGQARLNIHMDVFELNRPSETTLGDFLLNFIQPANDCCEIRFADDADFAEHLRVCSRTLNVLTIHALIELHRGGKLLNKGIHALAESPTPLLIGFCLIGIVFRHDRIPDYVDAKRR